MNGYLKLLWNVFADAEEHNCRLFGNNLSLQNNDQRNKIIKQVPEEHPEIWKSLLSGWFHLYVWSNLPRFWMDPLRGGRQEDFPLNTQPLEQLKICFSEPSLQAADRDLLKLYRTGKECLESGILHWSTKQRQRGWHNSQAANGISIFSMMRNYLYKLLLE